EGLERGEAGLLDATIKESIGTAGELVLDQQVEKIEMRERGGFGLSHACGEGFDHPGQAQRAKTRGKLWIHERKCSRVYWVMGRIAGSSAISGGRGAAGVASVSRRIV